MNILRDIFNLISEGDKLDIISADLLGRDDEGTKETRMNRLVRNKLKKEKLRDLNDDDKEELMDDRLKERRSKGFTHGLLGVGAGGLLAAAAASKIKNKDDATKLISAGIGLGAAIGHTHGSSAGIKQVHDKFLEKRRNEKKSDKKD